MPDWLDTPAEFFTILSVAGILLAALIWLIRAQIAQSKELKPNHGTSLRDAVSASTGPNGASGVVIVGVNY